jgi:hypothetical protein
MPALWPALNREPFKSYCSYSLRHHSLQVHPIQALPVKSTSSGKSPPSAAFSHVQLPALRWPHAQVEPLGVVFSVAARSQVHWPAGRAPTDTISRHPSPANNDAACIEHQQQGGNTYGMNILRLGECSRRLSSRRCSEGRIAGRRSRWLFGRRRTSRSGRSRWLV